MEDILLATILGMMIPTLAVLVGILLNQNNANWLDQRISASENRLDARIMRFENRLDGRITGLEKRLDGRINVLDERIDGLAAEIAASRKQTRDEIAALAAQIHSNTIMLIGRDTEKAARLARLEAEGAAGEIVGRVFAAPVEKLSEGGQ